MFFYHSKAQRVFGIFNITFLFFVSLTCILPFLHLLAVSLSSSTPVTAGQVHFWPKNFTVQSYKFLLTNRRFLGSFLVSMERVLLGVSLNLILCVITAYPLSRSKEKFTGRNWYMIFFVLTMIIGGGLIPTYLLVMRLKMLDTIWALVLPGALPVGNMVIMMNFLRQLPLEIEDAAMIDGAGPLNTLVRIILPLLKPAIATIGLFCVVGHWNEWFSGLIYMRMPEHYPLQTYLQTLLRNFDDMIRIAGTDYVRLLSMMNARTGRAAQLFIGMLPVIMLYPFLQRYFVTGLVIGSVKG
jgi:putative aldouronate transport system permease protein